MFSYDMELWFSNKLIWIERWWLRKRCLCLTIWCFLYVLLIFIKVYKLLLLIRLQDIIMIIFLHFCLGFIIILIIYFQFNWTIGLQFTDLLKLFYFYLLILILIYQFYLTNKIIRMSNSHILSNSLYALNTFIKHVNLPLPL